VKNGYLARESGGNDFYAFGGRGEGLDVLFECDVARAAVGRTRVRAILWLIIGLSVIFVMIELLRWGA
jgi:hypothetical protein